MDQYCEQLFEREIDDGVRNVLSRGTLEAVEEGGFEMMKVGKLAMDSL